MSSNGKRSYEYDDQSRSRGVRGKGMDYCQGQQQQQQQHHPAGGRRANDQPSTSTSYTSSSRRPQSSYYDERHSNSRERRSFDQRHYDDSRSGRERPSFDQRHHDGYRGYQGRNHDRNHDRSHNHNHDRSHDRYSGSNIGNGRSHRLDGDPRQQPRPQSQHQKPSTSTAEGAAATARAEIVVTQPRRERSLITDVIRTTPANVKNKHGQLGASIPLLANYFRILKKPTFQMYQHHVDFSPNIEIRGLKRRLIFEQKPLFGACLFDGTILVTSLKLEKDETVFQAKDRDANPIKITVKFTRLVSPEQSEFILNLILRKSMASLDLVELRRNFFDPIAKIDLPRYKLQLWPGYITSIRQHETDILLCAEITTKVMRSDMVIDILNTCYDENPDDFKTKFEEHVTGMVVLTDYNNKTFRIDDFDYSRNPSNTFQKKDGTTISFEDYYRQTYNINIIYRNQPLLISRASAKQVRGGRPELIVLLPELCRVTGLSNDIRCNNSLMKELANITNINPNERTKRLMTMNGRLQRSSASVNNFEEWGFRLDKQLVKVPSRCLANEKIIFGGGKLIPTNQRAQWSQECHKNEMYLSVHLTNWAIIYPEKLKNDVKQFVGVMQDAARGMRYNISNPKYLPLLNDRNIDYGKKLNEAASVNPQLIMCIVFNDKKDKYIHIKTICCVERGIASQVITSKNIKPKPSRMSIATNVVIQINSKLGGVPWMVPINHKGLMVVGYDACHDTVDKSKSYGAMVATMDLTRMQNYYSTVDAHKNGQELSDHFGFNIVKAVTAYRNQHGSLPAKIIIYRDGVGDGQIQYVVEHEIKDIQAKLKQAYNGAPFQLGFVVVSKKINTRFFTDRTTPTNPSPGTVVDRVVTLSERFEFYLVSQHSNQGTVSPTNYNILHDDMQFTADEWQVLTYKMTHLYYNWSGTVSVPGVCRLAHRLAYFVANVIHKSPSYRLEKQLYFL